MSDRTQTDVKIRPWADDDLPLLERLMGDPAMTVYLGGPESAEEIRVRHKRYCQIAHSGKGRMFVIVAGPDNGAAGSVGYWEIEWGGELVWETGWSVLPEFQGQRIATKGTMAAVEQASAERKHRFIHAFPSIENGASNAICRRVGFSLQGQVKFEDRKTPGQFLHFNDWRLGLFSDTSVNV